MRGRGLDFIFFAARAIVLFGCVCACVFAADAPGVAQVRFRTYSTTEGLSQATARVIAQDATGFLWIGTQDGLNRFDGYSFKVYKHDRNDRWSLSDNHVYAILPDVDGAMWIATLSGGLNRYDPALDRFTHFSADPRRSDAIAADNVSALLRDHGDRLWIATTAGKLQWFDRGTKTFRDAPLGLRQPLRQVRAMLEQSDGSVLIATREGLWQCDAQALQMRELRDGAQTLDVYALAQSRDGEIWAASASNGLYRYTAAGVLKAHYRQDAADPALRFPDNEPRSLKFDRNGALWIATNNTGLVQMDTDSGRYSVYRHDPSNPQSLGANRQWSLMFDRDGLMWSGSWVNGISMHDPRTEAFVQIDAVAGDARALPARPVHSVYADADGTFWFGVDEGGGLVHFDMSHGVIERFTHDPARADSLSDNQIRYITRTRDGSMWLATESGGLERRRPGATGFEHWRHNARDGDSLASDVLLSLTQDHSGTLWIATDDAGVDELCLDCTSVRHHRHDPVLSDSIGGNSVRSVLETRDGELWFALQSPGGLDRYDRANDRFEHWRPRADDPTSLSSENLTTLMQDSHGDLWIGSQGGGLNHMTRGPDGPRFEAITSNEGLAADAIGGVVEDASGLLWASTTVGISRIDPVTRHVINFGPRDGAQPSGYFINAYTHIADGRIFFGGLTGVSVFDPAAVRVASAPQPIVTDLLLQNTPVELRWRDASSPYEKSLWLGHAAELNHRQDSVSFEFSALGFSDPESIGYSYKLEGLDEQWIQTSAARRFATYTNLAAGDYRLRVRARSDGQGWNPLEAEVALRVLPAPWASPLAYLAYLTALTMLGLLVGVRVRANTRRRVREQDAIRASEERLKYALWGSGGELWDIDLRNGRMLRENRLEHLAASHSAGAETLQAYRPFVHPDDITRFERDIAMHIKGLSDFLETSYRSSDLGGDWRWLQSRGRIVEEGPQGQPVRMVGTTQDITSLKRAEESLRKLNEELESRVETRTADLRAANVELRNTLEKLTQTQRQLLEAEKMAALGGLVAGIAHEINTPLGVTVTAASHLQEEARRIARLTGDGELTRSELDRFQKAAQESADLILRNLQRADRLIKSFKQVAVDQATEERRVIEIGAYLGEILVSMNPVLKKATHSVRIDFPQPLWLDTYPGALYQIFSNLLMNSLSHAFDAGQAGEIMIRAQRSDNLVLLEYIDNGKGMSEAVRLQIFEPFFTTARGQGGSGLGLHIVYNLVTQLLKGSIRCESAPGKGARFEIFLPDTGATEGAAQ